MTTVQEIKIKKFKKLENIDQQINGQHILLLGDNGVGKTSVLQFLEIAVGNQKKLPPGANGEGEITIDKDGNLLTVSVTFKDGKPVVRVKGKGVSIDNKKSAIAELFGAVGFDIEEFSALSRTDAGRKEQVKIFKSFFSEELQKELAKFEANVKNHELDRTELGRDIEKLKGTIALHPLNNLPDFELQKFQPTDTAGAMSFLKSFQETNEKITKVENGLFDRKSKIADKNTQIAELQSQINKLTADISIIQKEVEDGQDWLKKNEKKDTSQLETSIKDAADTNLKHSQAQSLLKDRKSLETYQNEYGEATALIESSREAIANAIRDEQGPIEGLVYDNDQLVYNGVPVHPDSLSKSEIMEIGFRLKLAQNPDMFVCIPEAESLGAERFLLIKQIADKYNVQIFGEQVQRHTKELVFQIMTEELISA